MPVKKNLAPGATCTTLFPNNFLQYLELDFGDKDRTKINPYAVRNEIKQKTGEELREISGRNKHKLTLRTRNESQTKKCPTIDTLQGYKCVIRPHPQFNTSKGLIYLRQFKVQDLQEFKENLQEQQLKIECVEQADFINSRQPGVNPYIITFNQESLPYTVYIPGEITDTVVYPFGSRPMMCKHCLEYGHTKKKCKRQAPRCGKCSGDAHTSAECSSKEEKCLHCPGEHTTGHKNCPAQVKEQKILEIVTEKKVSFPRARQMLDEKPTSRNITQKRPNFPTIFDCALPKGIKRTINPWLFERAVQQITGKKPATCRGKTGEEDTFVLRCQLWRSPD